MAVLSTFFTVAISRNPLIFLLGRTCQPSRCQFRFTRCSSHRITFLFQLGKSWVTPVDCELFHATMYAQLRPTKRERSGGTNNPRQTKKSARARDDAGGTGHSLFYPGDTR